MGSRGPAPKSKRLKLIQGTFRADRAARVETQLPNLEAAPPPGLTRAARKEWARVVTLAPPGFLSSGDRALLAQYCELEASVGKLTRKLERLGYTFTTPKGYICQRPEVGILGKQRQQLVQICGQLGFTPTSRHRVELEERVPRRPRTDADDYFDDPAA